MEEAPVDDASQSSASLLSQASQATTQAGHPLPHPPAPASGPSPLGCPQGDPPPQHPAPTSLLDARRSTSAGTGTGAAGSKQQQQQRMLAPSSQLPPWPLPVPGRQRAPPQKQPWQRTQLQRGSGSGAWGDDVLQEQAEEDAMTKLAARTLSGTQLMPRTRFLRSSYAGAGGVEGSGASGRGGALLSAGLQAGAYHGYHHLPPHLRGGGRLGLRRDSSGEVVPGQRGGGGGLNLAAPTLIDVAGGFGGYNLRLARLQ